MFKHVQCSVRSVSGHLEKNNAIYYFKGLHIQFGFDFTLIYSDSELLLDFLFACENYVRTHAYFLICTINLFRLIESCVHYKNQAS